MQNALFVKMLSITTATVLASSIGLPGLAQDASEAAKMHKRRGDALQSQRQLARAIAEYRKALAINPSDAASHNNLGLAFKDMDLLEDAESELRAAIDLKPDAHNYQYNLGVVMMRKSDLAGAEKCFKRAVEINPSWDAMTKQRRTSAAPSRSSHAIRCIFIC